MATMRSMARLDKLSWTKSIKGNLSTLSLILISQEQVLDMLETAVISRMGATNHIRIQPYTVEGLESIALQRAQLGLVHGTWTPEIIRLIADKAAPSGDARKAIELRNAAVERCEFRQDGHNEPHLIIEFKNKVAEVFNGLELLVTRLIEGGMLLVAL